MTIVYFNSDDDSGHAGDLQSAALFKNILDKEFVPTKGVTDYTQYGGSPILGFEHLFIKCHGRSTAHARIACDPCATPAASAVNEF